MNVFLGFLGNFLTSVQFIDAALMVSECRDDSLSTVIGIYQVT